MSLDESIVLYRLSDYERRGWISQIDSAQYRSVMNQRRGDAVTLRQISHRLDELALNGGARTTDANANKHNKKEEKDDAYHMASPTATSSSSATTASSYSGATTNSMASTADDGEEEEFDEDDDDEEGNKEAMKVEQKVGLDDAKAKKDKPPPTTTGAAAAAATAASSLSAPYLRSLQCISNLAAEAHGAAGTSMMQSGTRGKPPAITASASHSKHHHVTWKDDNADVAGGGNLQTKDEQGGTSTEHDKSVAGPRIVEPSQLWNESNSSLNPALLQELFVEMCFYARLGFVQPPCCLKCTYRHAHNDKQSSTSKGNNDGIKERGDNSSDRCQQFVVWRKDATALLHPGTLATNIVLVPCQSAQQLLDGQVVSEHYWDAAQKKLRTVVKSAPAAGGKSASASRTSHKA